MIPCIKCPAAHKAPPGIVICQIFIQIVGILGDVNRALGLKLAGLCIAEANADAVNAAFFLRR